MAGRLVPLGAVTFRPPPPAVEARRFRCSLCGGLELGMPGPGETCSRHPADAVARHARRGGTMTGREALETVMGQARCPG
jgi:hypothetical protein